MKRILRPRRRISSAAEDEFMSLRNHTLIASQITATQTTQSFSRRVFTSAVQRRLLIRQLWSSSCKVSATQEKQQEEIYLGRGNTTDIGAHVLWFDEANFELIIWKTDSWNALLCFLEDVLAELQKQWFCFWFSHQPLPPESLGTGQKE